MEMKAKKATEHASGGTIRANGACRVEEGDGKGTGDPISAVKVIDRRDMRDRETSAIIRGPETFLNLSALVIAMKEIRNTLINAVFRVEGGSHHVRLLAAHMKTNAPNDIKDAATEAVTVWMNRYEVIELAMVDEAIRDKVPHVWPGEVDRKEMEVKLPMIEAEASGKHRFPEMREG